MADKSDIEVFVEFVEQHKARQEYMIDHAPNMVDAIKAARLADALEAGLAVVKEKQHG